MPTVAMGFQVEYVLADMEGGMLFKGKYGLCAKVKDSVCRFLSTQNGHD